MSDYTIMQLAKLEKYKKEFLDYLNSTILMANGFKHEVETKYDSLTPKEKELYKTEYLRRIKFFEDKVHNLESIITYFKKVTIGIKKISRFTEEAIRVHTAVEVVKEQFDDSKVPSMIKKAYNDDREKRSNDTYDLESVIAGIGRLSMLLKEEGLLDVYIGNKTMSSLVDSLETLVLEVYRTHSVDKKYKESIVPTASISTEERIQLLDEYNRRVRTGEMNTINVINSRTLFTRSNYSPSRVMITGEKSRAALVRISTLEKQIEAVDKAISIMATDRHYLGFENTYMVLSVLKYALETSLQNQLTNYSDDEIKLIGDAIGKDKHILLTYAEMYAELEMLLKNDPQNVDKISMMRVRLLQYAENKKMSSSDISEAIKLGRQINKDREVTDQHVRFRIDLDKKIMEEVTSKSSLEERVLFKLKEQGVLRRDATIQNLTGRERVILDKQLRLEEEAKDALEKFRLQKLSYDKRTTTYRQHKFSRKKDRVIKR